MFWQYLDSEVSARALTVSGVCNFGWRVKFIIAKQIIVMTYI